ncbi:MAG: preprotein translocase subunit SecG, partial [Alphaproteobacteria bacterium]
SRSAGNLLTKATAIIATLFIITSISLTIIAQKEISTSSVLDKVEEKQDPSEPQIPKSD